MNHPETDIVCADNGPCPNGPPDRCFYCNQPLGQPHEDDCACRSRTVILRYTIDTVCIIPAHWTAGEVEFHRNDGTWCSTNLIWQDLLRYCDEDDERCLCHNTRAKYVREADKKDECHWFGGVVDIVAEDTQDAAESHHNKEAD